MSLNDLSSCQFAARTCHVGTNRADRAPRTDCHSTRTDPVPVRSTRTRAAFGAWENHSDNEQSLVAASVMEINVENVYERAEKILSWGFGAVGGSFG
jgi:hypothetical protein